MTHHQGASHRSKSVRPLGFFLRLRIAANCVLIFFPNPLGTVSGACVEFYDESLLETYEYDQGVVKEYNEDPSTMVIFVSIFPYYPLQSRCYLIWVPGERANLFSAATFAFVFDVQNQVR